MVVLQCFVTVCYVATTDMFPVKICFNRIPGQSNLPILDLLQITM